MGLNGKGDLNIWSGFFEQRRCCLNLKKGSERHRFAFMIYMYFQKCIINFYHSVTMRQVFQIILLNCKIENTVILNLSLFKV